MQPPYPAPITEWHNDTYDAINPRRPALSQAGKTIVVTGGGRGIGREVVNAFAEAGASTIHILGRTQQTLEETKGAVEKLYPKVKVIPHIADIVDAFAVGKAAKEIGPWDVIIANAGYIIAPERIEDGDADEWWKALEINVKGNYVLARAFLPYKKTGSTIVGYSSGFGFLPPSIPFMSKNSAYSIAKMGTARFYEFLAFENPDLTVFSLQPGVIRTDMYKKGQLELDTDSIQLPAHFSVWLASHEAKPFSGRFLFANWDVEQLKSDVAPRLETDPVYLTTSLSGFPFNN